MALMYALDRNSDSHDGVADTHRPFAQTQDHAPPAETFDDRRTLRLLIVAIVLTAPMVVPLLRFPFGTPLHLNPWIELVLATPVQFVAAAGIYRRGWRALTALSCSVDLLVALGTTTAYLASVCLLLRYGLEASGIVYFEVSSAIIVLAMLGRWLDERALLPEPGLRPADRLADIAVPAAFAIAFATLLGWWGGGRGFEYAAFVSMSVFIIACPGALT